jgi:hypothetical protein
MSWSNSPKWMSKVRDLRLRVGTGPDLYSTQLSADGTQTIVQAFTADGQQMWQTTPLPVANNNSVPDAFGGLLLTLNNTCKPGQTVPMTIRDLDPTGQTLWEFTAAQIPGVGYCYAGAPQMAVRGDGAIAVSSSNLSGLPEIMLLEGMAGYETFAPPIPQSCYTQSDGTVVCGYSLIGAPIVDPSGSVYAEYEVRNAAYPPKITSSVLYLLEIAPGSAAPSFQLSSTTQDEALLPGRIIPDGQGGVLATWTVSPSNPPVPQFPYQAADVISGVVGTPYNLPFSPKTTTPGQSPTLVLGENGTAFAAGTTTTTDGTNTSVDQIVSFNVSSGAVNWIYQAGTQSTLSLMDSTAGNTLIAKITDQSGNDTLVRFDANGTPTVDRWSASNVSYFIAGSTWLGSSSGGSPSAFYAVPVQLSTSSWYGTDGNGADSAVQDVSLSNFSQTGTNQTIITNVFQKIAGELPSYSSCSNWLQGSGQNQGRSGLQQIQGLLTNNLFGHATVNILPPNGSAVPSYTIAAFSGTQNPDKTNIPGLPSGAAMTVNDIGAFFNQTDNQGHPFSIGEPKYAGNSPQAQATILVHEVAHQITVSGFQPDFGNKRAGKANDHLVNANCKTLVEAH